MRLARQIRFSFDEGGKLFWQYPSACPLNTLFANTMYAHFFIKGGAAYSQQRRRLCQVSFGYGYCRLDLFNVPFLVFLQTSVYLFFLGRIRSIRFRLFQP